VTSRSGTTLRGRLLLSVVIAFIPLLALEAYLLDAQSGALRQKVLDERRTVALSEAQIIDTFIEGKVRTLQALAATPAVRGLSLADVDHVLRAVTQSDPTWLTVALSGADGLNLSSLTTPLRSVNISDRDYFQGALAGKPTVGTALLARSTGQKTLVIAVPVDANGSKAVLSGALSLTNAEGELRRSLRPGVELVVVDRRGQQFIGPGIGETFPILTGRPAIDAALRGEQGAMVTDAEGTPTLVAYASAGLPGWGVVLREPAAAAFAEIDRQRGITFALTGIVTAVAVLLALVLGTRLERTYAAVESARGDLERSREDVTRERDRLQRVIDEMPLAVAIYDRAGRVLIRNATYGRIIGGAPPGSLEEVRRFYDMRYDDGREIAASDMPGQRALRGETVRAEQHVLRHGDTGESVNILVDAVPLHDGAMTTGALVVFQDITALKAVERERSAFFEMASHEIKTPLTALLGHVQLALRRMREGRVERIEETLTRAEQGGRRLADLVRDLLDVTRLAEGRFEIQREPVELGALVTTVINEATVAETGHEISFARSGEMAWVDADGRRLMQVLQNLIDNAIRYSPRGGRIDVTLRREGGEAVVRVADRGVGIPEEERSKLFQRFFRTSRTQSLGGTGLGLFISRRIAEVHGGRLDLESTGPGGSVFVLALPLAPREGGRGPGTDRGPAVTAI
jgi:signal transduction histidine kinase